jgi:FtsH-binding integral membrane protein
MDTALEKSPAAHAGEIRIIAPEVTVRAQHRGVKTSVSVFVVCMAALVVSGIVTAIRFTEDDGVFIWAVVVLGAAIIGILLGSILAPFLKAARQER